jgi:hypothetical protein
MSDKYDEAMQMICNAARFKMTLNSHKGDIERLPVDKAVELCKGELQELLDASSSGDNEKALVECADAFNFIVAIAVQATEQYRSRKK